MLTTKEKKYSNAHKTKTIDKKGNVAFLKFDKQTWLQFKDMMTYTFNADVDGMLCCDWSGEWEFWDSLSATSAIPTISAAATVIMLINGVQVGIIYRASDARERDTHVMYGAFPVSAGNVTVTIRARVMTLGHTTPEVKPYGTNRYLNFNEQILVMIYRKR